MTFFFFFKDCLCLIACFEMFPGFLAFQPFVFCTEKKRFKISPSVKVMSRGAIKLLAAELYIENSTKWIFPKRKDRLKVGIQKSGNLLFHFNMSNKVKFVQMFTWPLLTLTFSFFFFLLSLCALFFSHFGDTHWP